METTELSYPVFEANQVLSDGHLNDMFAYLDEQSRLTRADLIGIGIVCGLDARFDAPGAVVVSRGCGVTSQGYLIVEPLDLTLQWVREYRLPAEVGYEPFTVTQAGERKQIPLWELFADDDEPGAVLLTDSDIDPSRMAVVLFLELRHDRAQVCSPNDCDDRGGAMSTTVRRLLVDVADLDRLNAALKERAPATFGGDVGARLGLPDLRMPRFDVPASGPATAESVLAGFSAAFRRNDLVASTGGALKAVYRAFEPILKEEFPNNPFARFERQFGFLGSVLLTTPQVLFLQYYWDFFDDLIAAYDELRWKGVDLVCACCPPDSLFPRHLTLGLLRADLHATATYRHRFVPSPAVGDCAPRTRAVRTLFRRLVGMVRDFTESAPEKGVRITPSLTRGPLSQKAIPYYYVPKGSPPLREAWDPVKTERGKATQNLGYRSDEYPPPVPVFVTDPLRFELEPNDFLRIEGHLGRDVHTVLTTLLTQQKRSRLPFDVVAVRAGAFDESIEIDLDEEDCCFDDLDTLYATLIAELRCFLVKQVEYFYDIPITQVDDDAPAISPKLGLLRTLSPKFRAAPGTVGSRIEGLLAWEPGRELPFTISVAGVPDLQSQALRLVSALNDLAGVLTDDLRELDFDALRQRYAAIVQIAKEMEGARRDGVFNPIALATRIDDIVFRCRLEPFEALEEEYRRRIREVKKAQFLSHFLEQHPGIQHKAGVPLGGTFVLVYHQDPPRRRGRLPLIDTGAARGLRTNVALRREAEEGAGDTTLFAPAAPLPDEPIVPGIAALRDLDPNPLGPDALDPRKLDRVAALLDRIVGSASLAGDPDIVKLSQEWRGIGPALLPPRLRDENRVFTEAVGRLADGTIIADFYLPYMCRSNCPPIQYQLPSARLKVTADKACTNAENLAEVTLTVEGASGSLSVRVDDGASEPTDGTLLLPVGRHTLVVSDGSGGESAPVEIEIPRQLVIGSAEVQRDAASSTFVVTATIEGGTAPYLVDPGIGAIAGATFTSAPLKLTETLTLVVTDAAGCRVETTVGSGENPCTLPCGGEAIRQGHRFWLPEPRKGFPINELQITVEHFSVTAEGTRHDLTAEVAEAAQKWTAPVSGGDFAAIVGRWLRAVSRIVAGALGSDDWFGLEYLAPPEGGDVTGVLRIERLACVEYQIELVVTFLPGGADNPDQRILVLTYNSEGTGYIDRTADVQLWIPRFGIETSNKCIADTPWRGECEGIRIDADFRYTQLDSELQFELSTAVASDDAVTAIVWEVQDAVPPVSEGASVIVAFRPAPRTARLEPRVKRVLLTVHTEKGCTLTRDLGMDLSKPQG